MKRGDFFAATAAMTVTAGQAASVTLAQDKTYTIGVSIPSATHQGWPELARAANIKRLEARYPQLKFVLATAGEASKQVNDLEDMMATRNIDGLVVLPFESEPLTGPVKAVKDAGKWVTVVDRGLSVEGIEDLYVAGDNTAFGRTAGEYFRANLPADARIVVLRGIPTTIDNERVDAFQKAIEGSGIKIIDMQHGNWNRDDAFSVMQDFLSKHARIDAVWASDDDMAVGVMEAIAQAGREKEMWIIGGAGMKEMVKRVMDKDPLVPVDVTYPPALISAAIEITALRFVSDTPVYGRFIIGSTLITPENAESFYFPDSPF